MAAISTQHINQSCNCKTIRKSEWNNQIRKDHLFTQIPTDGVFSESSFFLPRGQWNQIQDFIQTLDSVLRSEKTQSLSPSQEINRTFRPTNPGFLLAFDFHTTENGAYLIEINSNPGGYALSTIASHYHASCCDSIASGERVELPLFTRDLSQTVERIFQNEWTSASSVLPQTKFPRAIAIVDAHPQTQFLYPEFLMYQSILKAMQIPCWILDPSELTEQDGYLTYDSHPIDMIYNRHTDFYLRSNEPGMIAIRKAYTEGKVVLTPHPYIYETYADKENFIRWSDPDYWNLLYPQMDPSDREKILAVLPKTKSIETFSTAELWENRKKYFFKPTNGHGSKAVYRGDKLTKKVFDSIVTSGFIVQENISPALRRVDDSLLKSDIRVYTYQEEILGLTARLYQGQVTNLRTPGGGFAPVLIVG